MDTTDPIRDATISQPQSTFNFPKVASRGFVAADLIAILKMYNREFADSHHAPIERTAGLSRERCYAAALDALSGDPFHKRVIFRGWPRSPTGKFILSTNSLPGKEAPNGLQLWGATMFDFYRVRRIPDVPGLSTITTGSKLMRWMKANGELDAAKDEIEWAENEEEPKVIEPYPLRKLIERQEEAIRIGQTRKPMFMEKTSENEVEHPFVHHPVPYLLEQTSRYPLPWVTAPFSYPTQALLTRLPLHYLPTTITVHDPWNLLAVESSNCYGRANHRDETGDWSSVADRTHTFKLKLSSAGGKRREEAEPPVAAAKTEQDQPRDGIYLLSTELAEIVAKKEGYLTPLSLDTLGFIPPPIFVLHDPPPPPPSPEASQNGTPQTSTGGCGPIDHAHLYLSPVHHIGYGNHSVVYRAEWEIPRSSIFPPADPILCKECVNADIDHILREEDGDEGERKADQWKEKRSALWKIVKIVRPSVSFEVVQEGASADQKPRSILADPGEISCKYEFEGPVRAIRTSVSWQDPLNPLCEHLRATPRPVVPQTVKVRLVAKLSKEEDEHLEKEARNYQRFERHMFEHWNGLNVLPPMHDPIPLGALVPQFYGHYVPEPETEVQPETTGHASLYGSADGSPKLQSKPRGYLSPILLMEDCGSQVDVSDLTTDEK